MDEYIRDLARQDYNPPPQAPRDEMWDRIRAARQAGRLASGDVALTEEPQSDVIPLRRRLRGWSWRALPVAALLLLAFGLGRLSLIYERPGATVATRQPTTSPAAPAANQATPVTEPASSPAAPAAAVPGTQPGNQRLAANVAAPGAQRSPANASGRGRSQPQPLPQTQLYRFAAAQTFGQAELLLTSFRADARQQGQVDAQIVRWADDVLSSTRLLLDSPAGRDPKLRPLLEDLELVLVQIVQLGADPSARPGDADLVDHALQERDLLPRLRTAVPAGVSVQT